MTETKKTKYYQDCLESLEMFVNDQNPPEEWFDEYGYIKSEYEDEWEEKFGDQSDDDDTYINVGYFGDEDVSEEELRAESEKEE